jgi:hypothetical protein
MPPSFDDYNKTTIGYPFEYAEASVVDVEAQLERATRKKVGTTNEEVMDWAPTP